MKYAIIEAEIIEWLKDYSGERFHAILSDPPYALISIAKRFGPGQVEAQEGVDGRFSRLGKGFMGQTWDGFDSLEDYQKWVSEWASLLIKKVLYPGAVCLFFGGTRTWHHLAVGLENGGFEIFDTLMWVYASGFPKSHSISKGIDKAVGKEREVTGRRKHPTLKDMSKIKEQASAAHGDNLWAREWNITKPATDASKLWEGYGTAMKPSFEPILMCRAPRNGKTFASLALEFGSGALNIDGARVDYQSGQDRASATPQGECTSKEMAAIGAEPDAGRELERVKFERPKQTGRWPANLILSHHESCQLIGEFEVEGRTINRWKEGMKPFGDGAGEPFESDQFPPETIKRWACVPECPIRQLDDQAGIRSSGKGCITRETGKGHQGAVFGVESRPTGTENISYGDTGYVSRFFKEVSWQKLGVRESESLNIPAGNAENDSRILEEIKENSARQNALESASDLGDQNAKDVENQSISEEISTAPNHARAKVKREQKNLEHTIKETPNQLSRKSANDIDPIPNTEEGRSLESDAKEQIPKKNLVNNVGKESPTDITTTTQSQKKFGDSADLVMSSTIKTSLVRGGQASRTKYCGKASRKEKDAGLETFFWKRVDDGYERISENEWVTLDKKQRAKGCIHPTVKPLELLQYLATLLLPPELEDHERRIFIPFSGSGSEIIGALKAGWDLAIGVEAEAKYNEIAVARVKHNLGMFVTEADIGETGNVK